MSVKTRIGIGILVGVYFFSHSFTQWIFGYSSTAQAADDIPESIIAVFVDTQIYQQHKDDINRYTQNYLQKQSSLTKALLIPLNKDNFQASDVRKILENLYQEGIKEKRSSLIGTVLIGDIPLPVIKENNYVYPSVYPYTDLSQSTYVFDNNSTYFVPHENGDQKAEIWQSLISFDNSNDYQKFFSKLKNYDNNPNGYTSNKIWYDDFVGLKKYFSDQFLSGYTNSFLFHEDITYHRFTNLLVDYLKDGANANAISLVSNYTANSTIADDDDYSQLGEIGEEYSSTISSRKGNLNKMAQEAEADLGAVGDESDRIPTLMIGQSLASLINPYTSLFTPEFLTSISENINAGGRRSDADVDSHIKKTVLKDNITSIVLLDANTLLEKALYDKLDQENYDLHIPIPLVYEKVNCGRPLPFPPKYVAERYENFYFGKSAFDISSTQDISIYPGTWKNIGSRQNLTSYDYTTQGEQDDIAIDFTARSIGASYGISSRQVESSRGYNTLLVPNDQKFYEDRKCKKSQEIDDFVSKYRGGISPLNIDGDTMQLKQNNPKMAWNPRFDTNIGGPVFDIAGSKMTLTKMNQNIFFLEELNNSMLHRTQQYRMAPWLVCGKTVPAGEVNENWYNGYPNKLPAEVEFFSKFSSSPSNVHLTNNNQNTSPEACGDNYVYKTIRTLESHTSPTPDQIKGMTPLTQDRPIDSTRFVAFKGIGGNAIEIDYPNIYNVEVYNKDNGNLTLKSPEDITTSIKNYLREKAKAANIKIANESTKGTTYYTTKNKAFDKLATVDPLASPKNRTYNTLPEDFFITTLGEQTISEIAQVLYWQNLGWYTKPASADLITDLQNNQGSLDINKKIGFVTEQYLTKTDNPSTTKTPQYETNGYELVYINSDGNDIIESTTTPPIVSAINQQKIVAAATQNSRTEVANAGLELVETQRNEKCGIEKNATVPLLKRPKALSCRMDNLKELTVSDVVKINFDNAQGPVLALDQFENTATVRGDNIARFGDQRKQLIGADGANTSPDAQALNRSLESSLNIKLNKASLSMDDKDSLTLSLISREDRGNLSVRISGTGENCPLVEGRNTCNSDYTLQRNLFTNPTTLNIGLASTKVGSSIIVVKVCQSSTCTEKQILVPIVAGAMTRAEIITPTDTILYKSQLPIIVAGYDTYGNKVEQTTTNYMLQTSAGNILSNGAASNEVQFQQFGNDQQFFLDISDIAPNMNNIALSLSPVNPQPGTVAPRTEKTLTLTNGSLGIKYNAQTASDISITLPESTDAYFSLQNNVAQLQESALPRIVLTLTSSNGQGLDSTAIIKTTNGLLIPGTAKQTTYSVGGKNVSSKEFMEQDSFTIKNGVTTVLLYPSFRAGEDTLTIEIPGLGLQTIPVKVSSANPYRVSLETPTNMLPEQSINAKAIVYDKRNNPVSKKTTLSINAIGDITVNDNTLTTLTTNDKGIAEFALKAGKIGGNHYLYGSIDGIAPKDQLRDSSTITTLAPQRKSNNLNAMYLLLGGSDWGNKRGYFTAQGNEAHNTLNSSDKTLAVTTLLTHPDRILPAILRVSSNGQLYDAGSITLRTTNSELIYDLTDNGYISLGSINNFSLTQASSNQQPSNNRLLYTPGPTDSVITSNEVRNDGILVNGEIVRSLDGSNNSAQVIATSEYDNNRDLIREVSYQGKRIGTIRLHAQINNNAFQLQDNAGHEPTWLGGSTNAPRGRLVYQKNASPLSSQVTWNGGLEESRDADTQTSWRNTFQAATAFAQGDDVGKATQHGASPFLITYGDPMLSRQSNNSKIIDTDYDAGIGNLLFTETEKSIAQTIPFDLDRNGQKDLLIIYTDGSVRVLKNNGGTNPFKDLGMLMLIADGIKNVYVGDADGNSYEDIIIQTNNDTLRVYKNNEGKMDVDGKQICLAIPGGDENVKNAHELFVEDMDRDGAIDIITNDTLGNITLFYGGRTSAGDNYVSKNISDCDENAIQRANDHKKLVKSYGVNLMPGQKTYDNSLVHWKGLTLPTEEDPNNEVDNSIASQTQFQNLVKGKDSDFSSLSVNNIVNSGLPQIIQYSSSPISQIPRYESNLTNDTIAYMPIHLLDSSSPVVVYKEYTRKNNGTLVDGEKIDVKVTLQAKQSTMFTYLDEIIGPWQIEKNDDGSISSWQKGSLPSDAIVDRNISNGYQYMIDNISLQAGNSATFTYTLTYSAPRLISISLEDINKDEYTDIKTYSTDSCQQGYRTFTSDKGKNFNEAYVDLTSNITQAQQESEQAVKDLLAEVQGKINEAADSDSPSVVDMPGMQDILENRDQGQTFIQNGNLSIDVNNQAFQEFVDESELKVDTAIKGLCQGFQLGNGGATSGPPVPFNMAFLSPGTYNIFGCKLMQDKGLPAFFFPGTVYAGPFTVPFPYGLKGSTDGFYWAPGGAYPSMIRIYVSPTLTMGVGIGICFGPYTVGAKIPSPFRHIAGNCIVLGGNLGKDKKTNNPQTQLTVPSWQYNLAQGGTCNRPTGNPSKPSSPFSLSPSGTNTSTPSSNSAPAGGYAGGLIYFDQQPASFSSRSPSLGSETLKPGKTINLQIEGGNVKGLVKCIINKWMDNQIRYIINNLTNLQVNIYLPELSTLFEGFDNVSIDKLGQLYNEVKAQTDPGASSRKNVAQSLFSKEGMRQNSDAVSNPFDAVSSLFENVPLININTKNVNVQIPFIAQEDLTKYKSYLTDWVERNEKILQEWNMIAQSLEGKCATYSSTFDQAACQQKVKLYIDISSKSAQVVRALKQNINVLEEYRRFPIELNKWLGVSQRYLTEVSDTISTFTYGLTNWLQLNARRFEQYVDAIILLISAVKTWQVLIDFSVNRKTKCGKCKVDNYDFYSCTLSLLCIDLPVLPIPNFRIPNINIDLSHVNLGMDIVLPKFNFIPLNVPLPRLPDLPTPPTIDIESDLNVSIPQIPVLPRPPTLPELPSFIPNIELNLPTLPPAPRIPKIAPSIQKTLEVAEFIAKVFCIVKGGIGLVAEKGVKTRIEQMTQRSRSVEPFDSLSVTRITPPLRGFDIEIDTYINMQLNFDDIYDIINEFANQINGKTNEVFSTVVSENIGTISSEANDLSNDLQNTVDKGNLNGNINLQGFTWPHRRDLAYDSIDDGRIDLLTQLDALRAVETSIERQKTIEQIIAFATRPSGVEANIDGIEALRKQAQESVTEKKKEIGEIQQKINDEYDNFVKGLQTSLVSNEEINKELSSSLFVADEQIKTTINEQEHPTQSYLALNQKVMRGFAHALATRSPEELNMSLLTYNETKNYVNHTLDAVDVGMDLIEKPKLLAANTSGAPGGSPTAPAGSTQADTSQYIKGVFVEDAKGNMVNVVNRDDIIDTLQKNQRRIDMNTDQNDDLLLWDNKQVWLKYANPDSPKATTRFTRLYRTPTFNTPNDIEKAVARAGWLNVAGSTFKIRDKETAPQGFGIGGQSFDTITLGWDSNSDVGYLVRLTDKVNNRYDHTFTKTNTKYVLVVSSDINLDGLFIYDELIGGQKRVSDLVSNGTILRISEYDASDDSIGLTLSDLPRAWQYISVAKLGIKPLGRSAMIIEKNSPRSHQEVAGVQVAGDNLGPTPSVSLIRTKNGETESQGLSLQPIKGNDYSLLIEWSDDSGVKTNSIVFPNTNTQTSPGATTTISAIAPSDNAQIYTITAIDNQGNNASYDINISRKNPDIEITNIDRPSDTTSTINTAISEGLDASKVLFERERNGIRTTLSGVDNNKTALSLFPLGFNEQQLMGGLFIKNDLLALKNSAGNRIGTVDKQSGEISLDEQAKATIDIQVTFTTNIPTILIKEKNSGTILFSIVLKGKTALNTTILNTQKWKQKTLNDGYGQTFSNGTCVADLQDTCQIYISTQGAIRLSDSSKNEFNATYSYNNNTITYTFFDRTGTQVATTSFISQPLP